MITCEKIFKRPQTANSLLGMSLEEFEALFTEFELAYRMHVSAFPYTRRGKSIRRRAAGAGRKYKYALCDRLLMTLFWLRAYTTYQVLGYLYDLDKTTVEENLKDVMHTLSRMAGFNFEWPRLDIPKLRSVQEVLDAFPDLLLIIDPEEHVVKGLRQEQ